jgi:hypothetical protein
MSNVDWPIDWSGGDNLPHPNLKQGTALSSHSLKGDGSSGAGVIKEHHARASAVAWCSLHYFPLLVELFRLGRACECCG